MQMKQTKPSNGKHQGSEHKQRAAINSNAQKQKAKKDKKLDKRKLLNSVLVCFLSFVAICGIVVFFVIAGIMSGAKSLSDLDFIAQDSSPILASNGETLLEVGMENRQSITYDQLSQSTVDAFLAIEDSRYFTHNGFDLPRFAMSAINNLRNGDLGQGGSTLTMQMIDNARKGDPDYDEYNASSWQKIEWKIQEIFLSMEAESSMSKQEILVNYLNKVNFGNSARGIQKGAQYYFGKDASQLNLSESAFLAGVVNAPNLFNPYKGTQWSDRSQDWINFYAYALERRDETLYQMLNHGYISEGEYKLAKSTELAFQLNGERFFQTESNDAILDLVRKEALEKYDIDIYSTSCVVHTSINMEVQNKADDIVRNDGVPQGDGSVYAFPKKELFDIGSTVMNTKTGEIVAMIGGRHFNLDDATTKNQVTERHQTGSTIKPILDYAPGFDLLGYATSHTFADIPVDIYGDGRPVSNSTHKYLGDVSFVEAVGQSYNTTASKSLIDVQEAWGVTNIKNYLTKLGFDQDVVENFNLQYGIGGSDMTSSTKTLAGAYAILSNDGKYIEPHIITKIEFPDEPDRQPIVADYDPVQTISAQAAYLMSDILHSATSNNYFMSQLWPQVPYSIYGKTGTSDWGDSGVDHNIPEGAIRDEWMVNYSGNYVVVTWEGFNGYDYVTNELLLENIPGRVNRALFDTLAANVEDMGTVQNPGGISTISHVKGKYPYAAPTENMPKEMIATGMIRSDKAKLEVLSAEDLKPLSSFQAASASEAGDRIHLEFAAYPDADKTKDPSHTKEYDLLGIKFTGNVFFDPAFVFGKVVYKANIKMNGAIIQTITTSSPSADHTLSANLAGQSVQVCGYYAYEHSNKVSNEMCANVTFAQVKEPVNTDELAAAIQNASNYLDPKRYEAKYVNQLNAILTNANRLMASQNVTQAEIDEQIPLIQGAVKDCINHPLPSEN